VRPASVCLLLATLLSLLLPPALGTAENIAELKPQVDRLVQPLVDSGTVVGLVVGLNRQGETAAWGYGKAACNADRAPDGRTLFEIGSVTKVFTALALADMVDKKEVRLEDPVAALLPESVKVPMRDDRPVRLVDLATHTSGLARVPPNLLPQIAKNPDNPFAAYTIEQLHEALSSGSLATTPGARYAYSNWGMGLLGHALARRAGTTYEELIDQRICKPLGLTDTRITLSEPLRERFAQGHDVDGRPLSAWDFPTLPGAGALRSTADDLLRLVSANLGLDPCPLAPAIELSHQPRHEFAKDAEGIALGWHLHVKEQIYWHNGQTGGFHSFVGFQKANKTGVVVLSNTAGGITDQLALQLLKLLRGQPVEPIKVRMPVRLDPASLDRYVGNYEAYPGLSLNVFRDGDRLLVQLTHQPAFGIYAESETEFYYRAVDARITFVKHEDGTFHKLVIHQNGIDLPAWKGGIAFQLGKGLLKALSGPKKPEEKESPK